MTRSQILTLLLLLMPLCMAAQDFQLLTFPNHELLSSERILYLMEDSEGCLWYATEGGGICRDDGQKVDVFHSDADHPDLLGSNNVGSLAEVGRHIIIGTFHGAYLLDKRNFTIQQLAEVDAKRIDDILVTRNKRVLLTANKKIYEFSYSDKATALTLEATYPSRWKGTDCYVSHLFEDRSGHIWATQWDGGLLRKDGTTFKEAAWPMDCSPSDLADDPSTGNLWIGTVGQGIVRYHPDNGTVEQQPQSGQDICIDLQLSADGQLLWMTTIDNLSLFRIGKQAEAIPTESFVPQGKKVLNRLSLNRRGQLLVAGSMPGAFAVGQPTPPWYDAAITDGNVRWEFRERQGVVAITDGKEQSISYSNAPLQPVLARRADGGIWASDGERLLACTTDSVWQVAEMTPRPTAIADDTQGGLWLSMGKDIRRFDISTGRTKTVIADVPDVSALCFTPDGTLWLGTIFGQIYHYKDGQLTTDHYATNEHGDGINDLRADSTGRLTIVCDRYVRLYDTRRQTLRQQSREAEGIYCIELQETAPLSHWSHPERDTVVERLPQWFTSWWMWTIYALLLVAIISLLVYNHILRRQRRRFLEMMKAPMTADNTAKASAATDSASDADTSNEADASQQALQPEDELLQKAIAQVEKNLSNDQYTVEELSSDLCMSRMTFYRKIQSLTGQKPTEFIRTIRLRHAAELLREGKLTVTEVSYATGFSSVSYFSRSFRTMYGVPPTQFS